MDSGVSDRFLVATPYVDFEHPVVQRQVAALHQAGATPVEQAHTAFEFVRDHIPHTLTTDRDVVTARASEALEQGTGICHAKANLLAALLRAERIPAGFGFQHLTLEDDDSQGYCLHAFVVAYVDGQWVPLDPNTGVEFRLDGTSLAFPNRPDFDEYCLPGIWADPDAGTMAVLTQTSNIEEAMRNLPDKPSSEPTN